MWRLLFWGTLSSQLVWIPQIVTGKEKGKCSSRRQFSPNWAFDPYPAGSGLLPAHQVKIMAADVQAPGIAGSSAAMVLSTWNRDVLVSLESEFHHQGLNQPQKWMSYLLYVGVCCLEVGWTLSLVLCAGFFLVAHHGVHTAANTIISITITRHHE